MPRVPRETREQGLAELTAGLLAELGLAGKGLRVLDIGCANIRPYSEHARTLAEEYVGLDLAMGELRDAAGRHADAPPMLIHGSAECLPFPDARFDLVLCNDMLAYTDKARVLAEIQRVLVPGGYLLSLYNNGIGWSLYKLRHPEKPWWVEWAHSLVVIVATGVRRLTGWRPFHTSFNTLAELTALAARAGLEPVRQWSVDIGFEKLNLVCRKPLAGGAGVRPTALITGGYVSQNMGSAAMSIVTSARLRQAGFDPLLLSKYRDDDQPLADRYGIALRSAPQLRYTFLVLPLLAVAALLGYLIPALIPAIRRRWFGDARLCYDLGGITFSRDRGLSGLLINLTWLLLPRFLRVPLIKGAQAIGPFGAGPLWRAVPPLLRRVTRIYSRGATTQALLDAAAVPNRPAADIAFLLEPELWDIPVELATRGYIAMLPSSVVKIRFDRRHGEGAYARLLAGVVDALATADRPVALIAHSYRAGETLNSNDLPVCQAVMAACRSAHVIQVDVMGRSPGELKYLISLASLCVTGRFHGMVAALGSGVPVVVTTWSHKYREVLAEFSQEAVAIPTDELSGDAVLATIDRVLAASASVRHQIDAALPRVRASAQRNFELFDTDAHTTLRRLRDR